MIHFKRVSKRDLPTLSPQAWAIVIIATGQRDFLAESVLITSWQDQSHKLHKLHKLLAPWASAFFLFLFLFPSSSSSSWFCTDLCCCVSGRARFSNDGPCCRNLAAVGNDSQRSRYELPLSLLISATEEWIGRSSSGEDTSSRYSVGPRCWTLRQSGNRSE